MNFLQQRDKFINNPSFNGISSCYCKIQSCAEDDEWVQLINIFSDNIYTLNLSPSAHNFLSIAYSNLGKKELAIEEKRVAEYLIKEILNTGNGSREQPYKITTLSDEDDVIKYMGKTSLNDKSEKHNGKLLHRITLEDGSEKIFDIDHLQRFIRF